MKDVDGPDHDDVAEPPGETADLRAPTSADDPSGQFPRKIGPYLIRRVIATGGMGTVYEAIQENPRRPAAVKVVKRSMASHDAIRRFEREAQALARLHHPGIAQIYEAGTFVESGVSLPFFALEYIPNAKTILEFAKIRRFDAREKLELFVQVCDAVHYGHQRGIIHRDLKPANILVDSQGRVRVIDFGVARAVDADQEKPDQQTQVGQMIGTAQYMSPEQFEADPNDLDVRSDVYALGVVLYELLSGRLPYRIEHSGIFEIARIVREDEPTALGKSTPGVSSEVESITTKALQKDRGSRYQSAFGLAEDIRRYLRGEAISAKPASLSYQLKVFTRKNKALVGLATSAVALLLLGLVATGKLYLDGSAARARAETAAGRAIASNEFLKNTLAAVVPPGFGDIRTIGDLCDRASRDLGTAFPDNPATEADIRNTIGRIYYRIGNLSAAEQQLRQASVLLRQSLGPTHEATLQALHDLNYYYHVFGPPGENVKTSQEYLDVVSGSLTSDDEEKLEARWLVYDALEFAKEYDRAAQVARELFETTIARSGKESDEGLYALRTLALITLLNGNLAEAKTIALEAFELSTSLPESGPEAARQTRNVYAASLVAAGDLDEAKRLYGHRPAPDPVGIEFAYQGVLGNLDEAVRILVLFETWCPFSQRYIPEVERLSRQYGSLGVEILGLTRTNRSSSDDKVRQFIEANHLSFSVLKESGRTWNYFDATGTPYTVVLHEGEVIWESPGSGGVSSRLLEGILKQG